MAVAIYQQRHPQSTILYFLVESLYEKVKAVWEQRFERSHGFWRGFVDDEDGVVGKSWRAISTAEL